MLWDNRFRKLTAVAFRMAVEMAAQGCSMEGIADFVGVQKSTVMWWLRLGASRTRGRYARFWAAMVRTRAACDEVFRRLIDAQEVAPDVSPPRRPRRRRRDEP